MAEVLRSYLESSTKISTTCASNLIETIRKAIENAMDHKEA